MIVQDGRCAMKYTAWVIGIISWVLALQMSAAAATAQANACAEVVEPTTICGSPEDMSRFGVRMSATAPEEIVAPNTVVKFDVLGAKDRSCSIVLPDALDIHDATGRKVATCSFSSVWGDGGSDSPVMGVVIKADVQPSGASLPPSAVGFDIIVAYD